MKISLFFTALFIAFGGAAAESEIQLPPPARSGGMPLLDVLNARETIRKFSAAPVPAETLSTLLWSANGINRENGKRTAPSAMNRQPIEIYVLLPDGSYFWNPADNKLELRSESDLRADAGRLKAPLYLLLVANFNTGARENFIGEDCGYVSQNIYLGSVSLGLGTCAIGSIVDEDALRKALKLDEKRRVMLSHAVGVPEKAAEK